MSLSISSPNNKLLFRIMQDGNSNPQSMSSMSLDGARAFNKAIESIATILEKSDPGGAYSIKISEGSLVAEGVMTESLATAIFDELDKASKGESENTEIFNTWKSFGEYMEDKNISYEAKIFKSGKEANLSSFIQSLRSVHEIVSSLPALLPLPSPPTLEFIKGELVSIGGKRTTNVHIVSNNRTIIVNCTKESAKKAKDYLYGDVYLSAWKHNNGSKDSYEYADVYTNPDQFEYYKSIAEGIFTDELNVLAKMKEIHELCRQFVEDNNEEKFGPLRRLLRIFDHRSVDISILKTITIILFPVKDHERVKELYDSIDSKLESLISEHRNNNQTDISSAN